MLTLTALLCLVLSQTGASYNQDDPWITTRLYRPLDLMVDITNNLGIDILYEHNFLNDNNIAFSPYGLTGILIALYEGVDGASSYQIKQALGLPNDRSVIRIGFRDIHRRLRSYFIPKEGFLAGLAFNNENVTFRKEYRDILQFYGYDFEMPRMPERNNTSTTMSTQSTEAISTIMSTTPSVTTSSQDKTETIATAVPSTTPLMTTVSSTTTRTTTENTILAVTIDDRMTVKPETTSSETPSPETSPSETSPPETSPPETPLPQTSPATPPPEPSSPETPAPETSPSETPPPETPSPETRPPETSPPETPPETTLPETTSEMTTSKLPEATSDDESPMGEISLPPTSTESSKTSSIEPSSTTPLSTESLTMSTTPMTESPSTSETQESEESSPPTSQRETTLLISSPIPTQDTSTPSTLLITAPTTEGTTASRFTRTTFPDTSTTTTNQEPDNESSQDPETTTESYDTTKEEDIESTAEEDIKSTTEEDIESRERRSILHYDYLEPQFGDQFGLYNPLFLNKNYDHESLQYHRSFLANGFDRVQVTYMTYDTVLDFAYIPYLRCLALKLPLDTTEYYLLILLPEFEFGLNRLIKDMKSARAPTLTQINYMLTSTYVRAWIPTFMLRGFIVLTTDLQKLGICDVFEPRQDDFKPITDQKNIYVRNIEQSITVTIRKYMEPGVKKRYVQHRRPVEFAATHPFLYFVMDAGLHVSLMAGKIVNPLNSRIL